MEKSKQKKNERMLALTEYETACNRILRIFCEKHDFDYEDAVDGWAAGRVGEIVCCGDHFVDMHDMVTDLTHDADKEEFMKWYYYNKDTHNLGLRSCNYDSWLRGCPRFTEAELEAARKAHEEIEVKKMAFKRLVNEYNERHS